MRTPRSIYNGRALSGEDVKNDIDAERQRQRVTVEQNEAAKVERTQAAERSRKHALDQELAAVSEARAAAPAAKVKPVTSIDVKDRVQRAYVANAAVEPSFDAAKARAGKREEKDSKAQSEAAGAAAAAAALEKARAAEESKRKAEADAKKKAEAFLR